MKGKLLLLGLGYVLWNVVSSVYGWDKNSEFRKKLAEAREEGLDTKMMVFNHLSETHKEMFHELDEKYITEESKAYLAEQWENLKIIINEYKVEGEKLIAEMKEKPEEGLDIISERLQNLYEAKKWQLDEISKEAPEQVKNLKDSLLARYEEFRNKKNT